VSRNESRVLIVEDHVLLAESLALALRLRGFADVDITDASELDLEAILGLVVGGSHDIVLLDLFLGPAGASIPLIPPLVERGMVVLVLTASHDRVLLARCLEAGAHGVFDKAQPFDDLVTWLSDAMLGRVTMRPAARDALLAELDEHRRQSDEVGSLFDRLTERERAVLVAIVDGATADEIATREFIAVSTVRSHIRSILDKLGVNSQLAAVALARRSGWPDGDGS
jgi:DNA-binding NarL/FixJ family response regulator